MNARISRDKTQTNIILCAINEDNNDKFIKIQTQMKTMANNKIYKQMKCSHIHHINYKMHLLFYIANPETKFYFIFKNVQLADIKKSPEKSTCQNGNCKEKKHTCKPKSYLN